jgi:Asp-tRNA(Asn)/Glu-tRNA(Gln) amidotransferase A subunit family amidase
VRAALEETAALLRSLGHTVVERKVDMRARDVPVIVGLLFRAVRELIEGVERPQRLERRTRAFARPGGLVTDRATERLLNAERAMAARLSSMFDDHDLLLTPVMSASAVPAGVMEGRGATVTYLWETGWGPVHDPLEHHRSARRLGPGGILPRRAAARGSDRRARARGANDPRPRRRARGGAPVG